MNKERIDKNSEHSEKKGNAFQQKNFGTRSFEPPSSGIQFTIRKKIDTEATAAQFTADHQNSIVEKNEAFQAPQLKSFSPPDSAINFTVQKKENKTGRNTPVNNLL